MNIPIIDMTHLFLLLLGFVVGLLTGFSGVGGGFLITPALNILGFDMVYSIGTGFASIAVNTFWGGWKHHRYGNVDLKLGIIMGLSSALGVEIGKSLVLYLEKLNLVGSYVRITYIVLLLFISTSMFKEYYQYRKTKQKESKSGEGGMEEKKPPLAFRISRIKIPPKISLPRSGINSISIWVMIVSGILIGFLSGFMGIGGGFMGLPLLIYVIGVPTLMAIGTSLVQVFLTSCIGTILYAMEGRVEWISVLVILAGSLIGVQIGVNVTKYVTGVRIRGLFALFLFVVAASIFLKQINLVTSSTTLLMGAAFLLSFAIMFPLIKRLLA